MRLRVLHVTECYGGGVSRAIDSLVHATPEYEHHLLWDGDEDPEKHGRFISIRRLPKGLIRRVRVVRDQVQRLRPDIVHAHSSWAGVYTRILPLRTPVVYEPHCFKFDDPNLGNAVSAALRTAERLLAPRARLFGTLSPHEDALVHSLSGRARTVRIPNVPSVPIIEKKDNLETVARKAVMIGRIVSQKDPAFFAKVAQILRGVPTPLEPVWVGDGDEDAKKLLRAAGVRVTGWLQPAQVADELDNAVYVHSACYEGFPISVLDAAARHIPIVARRIPSLAGIAILQARTPEELANLAITVSAPGEQRQRALAISNSLLTAFSVEKLHEALTTLYTAAIEDPSNIETIPRRGGIPKEHVNEIKLSEVLRADLQAQGASLWIVALLTIRGQATMLFRVSQRLGTFSPWLGDAIKQWNHLLTGCDISWRARIAPGLKLYHPTGVVIGAWVSAGSNCEIQQGVTLGGSGFGVKRGEPDPSPRIGKNVRLGSGAKVLGDITVGDGVIVGANCVVVHDTEPGAVLVGVPGRRLPPKKDDHSSRAATNMRKNLR